MPAVAAATATSSVLQNVYLFWAITEHMSVHDGARLGRVNRMLSRHWAYVCRRRLLPHVLAWHATNRMPAQLATPVALPSPMEAHVHGARVRIAIRLLINDLPLDAPVVPSPADAKYAAAYGAAPSVARVFALWLQHGRSRHAPECLAAAPGGSGGSDCSCQWPHVPSAFFAASLPAAEAAAATFGVVRLAAATLAYVVMATPFLLRNQSPPPLASGGGGGNQRPPSPPPLVPLEADGADEARAFVVCNGMFFESGAMDALAHRPVYEQYLQTGGIEGTPGQQQAWLCAARYLRRVDVVLPPPNTPSIRAGMSGGIGHQAWRQTVLTPAYGNVLGRWQRCKDAELQTCRLQVADCRLPLAVQRISGTGVIALLLLPGPRCVCTLRRRWLDGLWVARWMRCALDMTNGAVPLRCRILMALTAAARSGSSSNGNE